MEVWKDVEGYEGLYQVSNFGRIKSLSRFINNRKGYYCKEKILKENITLKGYNRITLYKNTHPKSFFVHRLVAQAFIENPNKYFLVNHKDENKLNNCVSNLEWCDSKYNTNYGTGIARQVAKRKIKINQYDLKGNFIKSWDGIADAEKYYNIPRQNICKCCQGKVKTAGGFIWKYIRN